MGPSGQEKAVSTCSQHLQLLLSHSAWMTWVAVEWGLDEDRCAKRELSLTKFVNAVTLFWIWILRNSIWGFPNSQFSLVITNCQCKQLWAGFSAIWKSNFSKGASDWDWSGSENAAREVRAQPLSSSSSWSICKSLEFSGLGIISC